MMQEDLEHGFGRSGIDSNAKPKVMMIGESSNKDHNDSNSSNGRYDLQELLQSGRFYGDETFSAQLIIVQISLLQSAYYACLSGAVLVVFSLLGYSRSLKTLFAPESFSLSHRSGVALNILVLLTSIGIAVCVAPVVERSKKCLDFSSTIYINHFLLCWLTYGFPTQWTFWITHIVANAVTTNISRRICMKSEMQEIIISKKAVSSPAAKTSVESSATVTALTSTQHQRRTESNSNVPTPPPTTSTSSSAPDSCSSNVPFSTFAKAITAPLAIFSQTSESEDPGMELSLLQQQKPRAIGKPVSTFVQLSSIRFCDEERAENIHLQ